jgi:hypothetical protein
MRESQYIDDYLAVAAKRRLTPSTYMSYTLHGKAKTFSTKYEVALLNAIERRCRTGEVVPVPSARKRIAYMRREAAERQGIEPIRTAEEYWTFGGSGWRIFREAGQSA